MKIFSSKQIRKADQFTIENEPIESIRLMERASLAFAEWFCRYYPKKGRVFIFCGTGNNGGDGMAVSRILLSRGWNVHVYIVNPDSKQSKDFTMNYLALKEVYEINSIKSKEDIEIEFKESDKIIDAIFGSGLSRKITGLYGQVIQMINHSDAEIISIDIPSGLYSDKSSTSKNIVHADQTISFQFPKLAFLLPENGKYVKKFNVVSIGLHEGFIEKEQTKYFLTDKKRFKDLFKNRDKYSYKNQYGHALIISGSYGKMGAAMLSSKACLRSGIGLLTTHVPQCGYEIMQSTLPEAMISIDASTRFIENLPEMDKYNAVGIGPGIDTQVYTADVIDALFTNFQHPIVIDADGINLIARHSDLIEKIPENSILTPHPGEFKRLVGDWKDDFDRLALQEKWSKEHKVIIVLKGAHSSISLPDGRVFFNSTGNPGMATAGSGDVLTGIITSFLGQGFTPEDAAIAGVFIHGIAGDIAKEKLNETSMIAGDIIDNIPDAINHLIQ